MSEQALDIICLGRAAVDFYAEQIGSRLEDVQSFAKYVGGSSLNIATGCARQGLRVAMLTRVGDEAMGRCVLETLVQEGVEVGHVVTDPQRLTALAILGIKDRDTFPLIFYRENCADMNLQVEDIDPEFIGSAKALLITGTHFSTPQVDKVSRLAIDYARAAGVKVVVDIDYRPVLWGLTSHGAGEQRFVSSAAVSAHLQSIVPLCDLIVGTEEEIHIAGGNADTLVALRRLRELSQAVIVCKRGALGASVFTGPIPISLDEGITVPGVQVEVLNVVGAGDAFMAGLLRGWLNDESWEQSLRYANACGALVVSRHGCTPAMPTRVELDDYLSRAESVPRPDRDARLDYLHRVTTRRRDWPEIMVLAFDHRSQFETLAAECNADPGRISELKCLLALAARRGGQQAGIETGMGILVDERFGATVLNELTGKGLWIGRPVELPGSRPLRFESDMDIGLQLRRWPAEQVVKCLLFYHPDDESTLRGQQEQRVWQLYQACVATGHELMLEIIPSADSSQDSSTLPRTLTRFYQLGIKPDWWKLPPPESATWAHLQAVVEEHDPYCRGVLLLGQNASLQQLAQGFRAAAGQPLCKGFVIGRSLWSEPARAWLSGEIDAAAVVAAVADHYANTIALWRQRADIGHLDDLINSQHLQRRKPYLPARRAG